MKAIEHRFVAFVARAGRAFVAAKGKDPESAGTALAEYLRSGQPIGAGEREMLAQLVTGEWRNRKGRPERAGPGHPYAVALVEDYRQRCADYGSGGEEAAAQDTAAQFGESRRTVRRYAEEADARDSAVARAGQRIAGK